MKKLFFLIFALWITALSINAQLVDVIVEEYGAPGSGTYPDGYMTYRVYALLQDPTDFLSSVFGTGYYANDPQHTLMLGSIPGYPISTTFWNSAFGGITGPDVNPAFCAIFSEVCYDSFVTIGRQNSASPGNAINVLTTPEGLLTPAFGSSSEFGTPALISDGGWFTFAGDSNGLPVGDDNRVLLMQVSCPQDELVFALNIRIWDESIAANAISYVHTLDGDNSDIDGEGVVDFSCMGLIYPSFLCQQCNDPLACNYNPESNNALNCVYFDNCSEAVGCMDPMACNFEPLAVYEAPLTCMYPDCIDETACNYNSEALCGGGMCDYITCVGCTDENACNFLPVYTVDDGSCMFGDVVSGLIYFDQDANGFFTNNGFFAEQTLSGVELHVMPENISVFTSGDGSFVLPSLPDGEHTITVSTSNITFDISGGETSFATPNCLENWQIGVNAEDYAFNISGPCCIWMMDIHCTNGFNPGIFVSNLGTTPLDGLVTIECDPLFEFEFLVGNQIINPTSMTPGLVQWVIEDQDPFSSWLYQIHVIGPGTDYIGETFPFDLTLHLYDEEGNEYYTGTWILEPTVVCAYDPNDKYTAEPGYTEENHFVLAEDEIEYRVRFQNTGNFPAETVVIRDTLDIEHLDFDSFYPVFASHDFMTTAEPNGALTFTFNDIMLPDSTSDQAGSQGYVVYRVRPRTDVEHLDVIENTAYIFFDGNLPIVTNTTWHTIFDCNSLTGIVSEDSFCLGDVGYFNAEQSFIDQYEWTFDDTSAGTDPILAQVLNDVGTFDVGVTISNPLCSLIDEVEIIVNALPEIDITQNGALFNAPDGTSWQWYQDGEVIEGANSQTFEAIESGYYEVFVTNENGCSVFSEEIMFVDVNSIEEQTFELFPNPTNGDAQLIFSQVENVQSISLYESTGKLIKVWNGVMTNPMRIDRGSLASGTYLLKIVLKNNQHKNIHVVFK